MKLPNGTETIAKPYQEEAAEEIVGVGSISSFWKSPTESMLLTIFVLPEFHRQGIGKKLVDSAMTALESEGMYKAALVALRKIYQAMVSEKRLDLQ